MDALGRGALAVLRWLIVLCVGAMVVLVFGNVVLRYGFNSGISISEEAARYFFVWLTFLGAVVAMYDHAHLGVDTLVSRLPVMGKKFCAVLSDVFMLGCCVLLLIGSWKQTLFNMDNAAPVSGVPVGVMHAAAVVSSVGLIIVITSHLMRVLSGRAGVDELVQVVESEERMPEAALPEVRK
ncbi:TRAP transporter small permease [Ottowia thiooxydans]|uniref:TRAP transporter small permease n=1 Tax=Ottowia thiooxydans TaxID=219182 RepID=UPI000416DE80|nr:TRAP transporter small permease [Ottowia thiooxydans]